MTNSILLDLEWSEASGPFQTVGSPRLFAWLRAAFAPGGAIADGRAAVVALDGASKRWAETSKRVTEEEARRLLAGVVSLELAEREPAVEPVVDTSDGWSALHVRVSVGERARAFTLWAQSSGLGGPDAEAVREVFRTVFRLAGYDGYDEVLYGRENP
jgi:hypothetical protein